MEKIYIILSKHFEMFNPVFFAEIQKRKAFNNHLNNVYSTLKHICFIKYKYCRVCNTRFIWKDFCLKVKIFINQVKNIKLYKFEFYLQLLWTMPGRSDSFKYNKLKLE